MGNRGYRGGRGFGRGGGRGPRGGPGRRTFDRLSSSEKTLVSFYISYTLAGNKTSWIDRTALRVVVVS